MVVEEFVTQAVFEHQSTQSLIITSSLYISHSNWRNNYERCVILTTLPPDIPLRSSTSLLLLRSKIFHGLCLN